MSGWSRRTPKKKKEEVEVEETSGSYLDLRSSRKKLSGEEDSTSLWLITFTDVMALMLTFFVLLYSMSVPEEEEWKEVTKGIQNQFSETFADQTRRGRLETINIDKVDFSEALDLNYLESIVANIIEKDERLKTIVLIPQTDHLVISVPDELLFGSGEADVAPEGKQVLFSLGNALARIRNRIEVIGHTDPTPIQNQSRDFGSNWELSLARAGSVSTVLKTAGYERPIIVRGLSSSRYDSLPEDLPEDERLSFARRVDIVIMQDSGYARSMVAFDITKPLLSP